MKPYKLSKTSRERLIGIKPILIEIIEDAIKTSPIDFGIPQDGGLRTAHRQNAMYAQGRTDKSKPIITNADGFKKLSRHQSGEAFDIYAYVDGKASWDIGHLTAIARHLQSVAKSKGVELEWGGDFKSIKDLPHLQLLRP
jgi:peptidoglycan L-alanyl-D-glutamate endopeptidase CwlK